MADLFNDPPAVVQPAEDLSQIFGEIKANDHLNEVDSRKVLERARKNGLLLLKVKEIVPHGQLQVTIEKYLPGKLRMAQRWMKTVRDWKKIQAAENSAEALAFYTEEPPPEPEDEPDNQTEVHGQKRHASFLNGASKPNSEQGMNTQPPSEPKPNQTDRSRFSPSPTSPPPTPPPVRTKAEQIAAKLERVREHLSEANFGLSDVATGPMGPLMLQLAEEMGLIVTKEFHGERDRFDRESQIHGTRVYFWQDFERFTKLLDAVAVKLQRGEEIEF